MLFLFVLMLVGVDSADSLVETLRGQRLAAIVLGLGFAGLLVFPVGSILGDTTAAGLEAANSEGNVQGIAKLLFTDYVFAFESISALLVVAAVGAMVLGHRQREGGKITQRDMMRRRFDGGGRLTPLPGPGVYAGPGGGNQPARLPSGDLAPGSSMGTPVDDVDLAGNSDDPLHGDAPATTEGSTGSDGSDGSNGSDGPHPVGAGAGTGAGPTGPATGTGTGKGTSR
jgi:NADH-quinone oxidoreductase subunit J